MKLGLIIFFTWIFQMGAYAQLPSAGPESMYDLLQEKKINHNLTLPQYMFGETAASTWFDVAFYRIELNISTQPGFLNGNVTIEGTCGADSALDLTFDLMNNMLVDSVLVGGLSSPYTQHASSFDIDLPFPAPAGTILSVRIFYQGVPVPTGFGSFFFNYHGNIPWIYSLSEPYGAKDWWPCKDDPGDKADSADIIITCDSTLKAGSQGILASVTNNGDGTSTYYWKERYPIASYLISIAVTNYVQYSDWFCYTPTDSMEIVNYILPEDYSYASQNLPLVKDMLSIYSGIFGLYPFIKEKYGHAEFGGGGAMEHQTMTSTTSFDEDLMAHELAHQWFGDMITCRTWSDLWLNEGFAEYCTAIYRENKHGNNSYREYIRSRLENAKLAKGAIGTPDLSSVRNLFDSPRMYSKGAIVLHMLRHVLGDSIFFRSIYSYANDPALKYSTATIADFQSVCEAVSGKDLSYFFQEWIYGEGYPNFNYSWTWSPHTEASSVNLTIKQSVKQNSPGFYTMPIDIRIRTTDKDTIVTVWNDAPEKTFSIKCSRKPYEVILDPDDWILKFAYSENDQIPTEYRLEQNYPNPFNSGTSIAYRLSKYSHVALKIYDILGHEVETLVNGKQSPGSYEYTWNPKNIASGIYFYRLTTPYIRLQNKMIYLK